MDCGNIANRVKTRRKMKKIEKQTQGLEEAWALLRDLEQEQLSDKSQELCEDIDEHRQWMTQKWGIEWLTVEEL